MRVRRSGGRSPQGTPTSGPRQHPSAAALSALLVALPLLVASGNATDPAGGVPIARGSERPPMSGGIDTERLSGLDLPIAVAGGVRTIANVDGSLPAPPRLATLFVPRVPNGPQGIPVTALQAYRNAAELMGEQQPGCHLHWSLVAGIGRIESNHAYGGYVDENGNTVEPILGPVLDGSGNTAAIRDTDDGKYDGNTTWDRAVGPMQFIPSTWRHYSADGNGDGAADPHNIYDATLAAGRYLCSGGLDLADDAQLRTAVYRYNHSASYVDEVLAWAEAYRNGVNELPDSDVPLAVPKVAAEPAREPVRRVSSGDSAAAEPADPAADTADSGAGKRQARSGRSGSDRNSSEQGPGSSRSTSTHHPSMRMTATSTTTTTTTSTDSTTTDPTTTTTTSEPTTSEPTTSESESTTTTTTTTPPESTTTTTTGPTERCGRDDEPTSTTSPSSSTTASSTTTVSSTTTASGDARKDACGKETSGSETTSTTPTASG